MTRPITEHAPRRKERGFTMIELMITVIVLAIMASAALPSFLSFITGQRIKTASFDLMALITFTRSEAIKRNANVTLNNSTGSNFTVTVGTTTLRQQPMFGGIQLDCVNTAVTPHVYQTCPMTGLVYNGNGRQATAPAFPPIEIHEPNASSDPAANYRCITIDLSGRPNSAKGRC